ncbi:MAG: hypothetical protein O2894_03050 [Planctomycetota bacterium]|nr:hypothetical protein [Planctomycetota bacterium]
MTPQPRIRSLLPPGGFSNLVGHYLAALDVGSEYTSAAARAGGDPAAICKMLGRIGRLESAWIHEAVGSVPTPAAPTGTDIEAWLGWLDAVRTVSLMVLRPLQDRDLERLVTVPAAADASAGEGPRTVKRLLAELLYLQGVARGNA